jgi:hypothetical protein
MSTPTNINPANLDKIKNAALNEARMVAPKYCEKCGAQYLDESFRLVQKNEKQSVFHLKCPKCSNTYILNVVSPGPNVLASQRSSLNIDLKDAAEMSRFAGKGAVSKDEALDVMNQLQNNDLEKLLK